MTAETEVQSTDSATVRAGRSSWSSCSRCVSSSTAITCCLFSCCCETLQAGGTQVIKSREIKRGRTTRVQRQRGRKRRNEMN